VGTAPYPEHTVPLQPGDRVYVYSDGVTEAKGQGDEPFGRAGLLEALRQSRAGSLEDSVPAVLGHVRRWRRGAPPADDVSVLAFEFTGAEAVRPALAAAGR
jgi:sigma-B regulation protein RsbU (phosphoserine phosphatase)